MADEETGTTGTAPVQTQTAPSATASEVMLQEPAQATHLSPIEKAGDNTNKLRANARAAIENARKEMLAREAAERPGAEPTEEKAPKRATKGQNSEKAETTKEEPETKKEPSAAKKFEALARKEAAIRAREQAIADAAKDLELLKQVRSAKSANKVLEAFGFTPKQSMEELIKDTSPAQLTEDQLAELVNKRVEEKISAWEAQKKADENANNWKKSILDEAKADKKTFPLLANKPGADEMVIDVVEAYFRETNKLLGGTPENARRIAMEEVEKYLEGELKDLDSYLQNEEVLSKLKRVAPKAAEPRASVKSAPKKTSTITNSLTALAPTRPNGRETVEELRAKARQALHERLAEQG